jgi:hypothetical protein
MYSKYINIPFRVIINEILCYLEVDEKKVDNFYGYFKKDYKRKIFLIFKNIHISTIFCGNMISH